MTLRYGSVCSGIEAATVAWHPLGWRPQFFAEIDAAPRAVLQHHYPTVPLHGDFTTIREGEYGAIDLLVGGTPCQSFSVAGLRGGLADDRGNLALQYLRLADRLRPRWLVWENVPGVLSSWTGPQPPSDLAEGQQWEAHETSDFGCFLSGMVELGYGFAYRVLDAQYVRVDGFERAVPQRRRRVFVVGYLGDWRRAAAVLFERACLSGHPAPRREAGTGTAAPSALSVALRGRDGGAACELGDDVGHTLRASSGGGDKPHAMVAHSLRGEGFDASEDGTGRGTPIVPVAFQATGDGFWREGIGPLASSGDNGTNQILAFDTTQITSAQNRNNPQPGDPCHPLAAGAHPPAIAFSCKDHGADATDEGAAPTLRAMGFDRSHANAGGQLAVALTAETMYGVSHANASQTRPDQALRALREAVGEEAYSEWGVGVVAALRAQEVLRSGVHGEGVRRASDDRHELDDDALPREETSSAGAVRALWEAGCEGCPPQGWQPSERLARELGAYLPVLPHQRASAARLLLGLWRTSEGLGLLRQALSALQEVWRPERDAGQPAQISQSGWAVRRLTPLECERLMGFSDGYTAVPWRNGIMPDGPRYKMLGNSMACNVMRLIGRRIEAVEQLMASLPNREAA